MGQAAGDPPHGLEALGLQELLVAFAQRFLGPPAVQLAVPQAGSGEDRDQAPPRDDGQEQQPRAVAGRVQAVLEHRLEGPGPARTSAKTASYSTSRGEPIPTASELS